MVRDAVKDARFNKEPEILPNCVRVFYGEGHHVDIATFRTYQEGDEIIKEIASDTGWKASDPRRITVWFHDTIVSLNAGTPGAGSQLRRLVRMLKRFAKSRGDDWDMPNGLKLTMLAVECHTPHDRDDEAFRSLLQSMSTRLMTDLTVLDLSDPGEAKVQLTKTSWDSNMMLLRDKTAEALGQLEVLDLRSCTSGDAAVAWDWVFQSDGFIQAFEKDAANAVEVFEKAVLAEAGLASTDSAMRIGTAGVANKEHRFYGDT
ncbi:MAG: hypothetical protein BWY99_02296 [Synergistetes bacterium ADurb.BinA166]|nr:MAG: hypothetical protein BWY99_02296 [Synergistetes bacterium ADurb.BinA166]